MANKHYGLSNIDGIGAGDKVFLSSFRSGIQKALNQTKGNNSQTMSELRKEFRLQLNQILEDEQKESNYLEKVRFIMISLLKNSGMSYEYKKVYFLELNDTYGNKIYSQIIKRLLKSTVLYELTPQEYSQLQQLQIDAQSQIDAKTMELVATMKGLLRGYYQIEDNLEKQSAIRTLLCFMTSAGMLNIAKVYEMEYERLILDFVSNLARIKPSRNGFTTSKKVVEDLVMGVGHNDEAGLYHDQLAIFVRFVMDLLLNDKDRIIPRAEGYQGIKGLNYFHTYIHNLKSDYFSFKGALKDSIENSDYPMDDMFGLSALCYDKFKESRLTAQLVVTESGINGKASPIKINKEFDQLFESFQISECSDRAIVYAMLLGVLDATKAFQYIGLERFVGLENICDSLNISKKGDLFNNFVQLIDIEAIPLNYAFDTFQGVKQKRSVTGFKELLKHPLGLSLLCQRMAKNLISNKHISYDKLSIDSYGNTYSIYKIDNLITVRTGVIIDSEKLDYGHFNPFEKQDWFKKIKIDFLDKIENRGEYKVLYYLSRYDSYEDGEQYLQKGTKKYMLFVTTNKKGIPEIKGKVLGRDNIVGEVYNNYYVRKVVDDKKGAEKTELVCFTGLDDYKGELFSETTIKSSHKGFVYGKIKSKCLMVEQAGDVFVDTYFYDMDNLSEPTFVKGYSLQHLPILAVWNKFKLPYNRYPSEGVCVMRNVNTANKLGFVKIYDKPTIPSSQRLIWLGGRNNYVKIGNFSEGKAWVCESEDLNEAYFVDKSLKYSLFAMPKEITDYFQIIDIGDFENGFCMLEYKVKDLQAYNFKMRGIPRDLESGSDTDNYTFVMFINTKGELLKVKNYNRWIPRFESKNKVGVLHSRQIANHLVVLRKSEKFNSRGFTKVELRNDQRGLLDKNGNFYEVGMSKDK